MYYGTKIEAFEQDDESVTIFADQMANASHLPDVSDWSRWRCKFSQGAPGPLLRGIDVSRADRSGYNNVSVPRAFG